MLRLAARSAFGEPSSRRLLEGLRAKEAWLAVAAEAGYDIPSRAIDRPRHLALTDQVDHGQGDRYGNPGKYWFHSFWVIVGVVRQIRAATLSTLVSHNRAVWS